MHRVAAVSYAPADAQTAALSARTGESTAAAVSARLAIDGGPAVRSAPFPQPGQPAPAADQRPVEAFERELAAFLDGERVVVACASHASAFSLAFRVAGLEGCEAVVPALHAGAVARALLAAELRPAPAEVDPETANLAARGLARAAGDQTRGLVVTHAFGHPAGMRDLLRLAERRELAVIEDITAVLGGAYAGSAAGTLGRVAALGFGAGHLLTGGGGEAGGAVIVADEEEAARVREWRAEAATEPAETSVRVALAELRDARQALQVRREAAWHLTERLRGCRGLAAMPHGRWIRHGYDRYVVRLRSMLWRRSIEETVEALRAEGIPCALAVGPPLHRDREVRAALGEDDVRLSDEHFAAASLLPRELLAIPLSGAETSSDMDDVAEALCKIAQASTDELGAGPGGAGR